MNIIRILYPSFPKIMYYIVFLLAVPALFSVCIEGKCHYTLKFFPGLALLWGTAEGSLTVFSIILWLALSYVLACLIDLLISYIVERRKSL